MSYLSLVRMGNPIQKAGSVAFLEVLSLMHEVIPALLC